MHAIILQVSINTSSIILCALRDALGGHDHVTSNMDLEAINNSVWRCTKSLLLHEHTDACGDCIQVSSGRLVNARMEDDLK